MTSSQTPPGRYRTIVADPPWVIPDFTGWADDAKPRSSPYGFMALPEICGLPVRDWVGKDAVLFLWTINAYIPEAYEVAWAWGFRPSKLLTWCKPPMGLGPGGTFASTSEFVLFSTRGKVGAKQRVSSSWFQWPKGAHSVKPEAFLDLVEATFPGPYLEMFSRRQRFGWDYRYGDFEKAGVSLQGSESANG